VPLSQNVIDGNHTRCGYRPFLSGRCLMRVDFVVCGRSSFSRQVNQRTLNPCMLREFAYGIRDLWQLSHKSICYFG